MAPEITTDVEHRTNGAAAAMPTILIEQTNREGLGKWEIRPVGIDPFAIPTLLRHLAGIIERGLVEGK